MYLQMFYTIYNIVFDIKEATSFQITSITISCISIIYGLSRYTLRNMLLRDPQIKENIIYAFTELSTSLNILILPFAYTLIDSVSYQVIPLKGLSLPVTTTIAIIIYFILAVIPPTLVSYYVLSPRIGFQLSMIIDGRIYFSFICNHLSSMKDLVIARRNILFVTLYKSTLVTNMVISAYYDEKTYFCGNCSHILIPLFFFFSVINGTVTILEITYILCTNKSFLNWVFLSSLKERTSASQMIV